MNRRAEAEAAARLDEASPSFGSGPWTPDAVVTIWAEQALHVELPPSDPIPEAIRSAFVRAQALLWDGASITNPAALVDDPARV